MPSDIQIWITALEDHTERMTAWEVGFLENVSDRVAGDQELSENQQDRLKEMYDKYV